MVAAQSKSCICVSRMHTYTSMQGCWRPYGWSTDWDEQHLQQHLVHGKRCRLIFGVPMSLQGQKSFLHERLNHMSVPCFPEQPCRLLSSREAIRIPPVVPLHKVQKLIRHVGYRLLEAAQQ